MNITLSVKTEQGNVIKRLTGTMPKEFLGVSRFNDAELSEWHIISTAHLDYIKDEMIMAGMQKPVSGDYIALLNHNEYFSGGLPIGKPLDQKIITGADGIEELWQLTKYNPHTPGEKGRSIGELTYYTRKEGYFTDSSIQFKPLRYEQKDDGGTIYHEWLLLEAGPVLIGANAHTGDMKSESPQVVKDLLTALNNSFGMPEDKTGNGLIKINFDNNFIKINKE